MSNGNPNDQVTELPHALKEFAKALFKWLTVFGILAVLFALFLPFIARDTREAARRTTCKNYLKQIGMALRNYASVYGELPPAYSVDANGKPLHSWRTLILPYLNQQRLYETIDLAKPWDDLANAKAYKTAIDVYHCPSLKAPATHTVYLAIVTPDSCIQGKDSRELCEVTDPSQTLMIIEAPSDHASHWMSPNDANEQTVTGFGPKSKLNHSGGTNTLIVDGGVRFLSESIPAADRRRLISVSGDEKAGINW